MRRDRVMGFAVVTMVGLAVGSVAGAGIASARDQGRATSQLAVPRALTAIRIDGELDDVAWNDSAARTGAFQSGGVAARPYSDARLTWRDGNLYLALYAADEDIVSPVVPHDTPVWTVDSFRVVFRSGERERSIDVTPRGIVTDGERVSGGPFDARWESRVNVAVDSDGTLDDSSDQDEEWVVEMAIPLDALGLKGASGERIGLEISRCDRIRAADGRRHRSCGAWGNSSSEIVLR